MKFYHYTTLNNRGGVTLAYELLTHKEGHTLTIAFAQVSDKDTYCKRKGRDISTGNMLIGKTMTITVKGTTKTIKRRVERNLNILAEAIYKLQATHKE